MDEDLGEVVVFGLRGESRVVLNIEKASFFVLWVWVIMGRAHLDGFYGGGGRGFAFVLLLRFDELVMKLIFDFLDVFLLVVFLKMDMWLLSKNEWFWEKHQWNTYQAYE